MDCSELEADYLSPAATFSELAVDNLVLLWTMQSLRFASLAQILTAYLLRIFVRLQPNIWQSECGKLVAVNFSELEADILYIALSLLRA